MTERNATYGLLHYCYNCPDASFCTTEDICQACWEKTDAMLPNHALPEEQASETEQTKQQLRNYWID